MIKNMGLKKVNMFQDNTDHIAFFCKDCNSVMIIKDIFAVKKGLKCTYFNLVCEKCKTQVPKKIYHNLKEDDLLVRIFRKVYKV